MIVFENPYNDLAVSLKNLALTLTGKTQSEIIKVATEQGEGGLIRLISENCPKPVTMEDVTAAISAALEAHVANEH